MKHPNRRQFLKAAGATLAAPLIVPRSLFGANAPSNRITVGMIGMGRQAYHVNLPPFLNEPDSQVVAVCDVDAWRLEQAKLKVEQHYAGQTPSGAYKGCLACKDFREVLARPDIDAVMISTPDHWHVPMSIAAVKAGKDVSCEKPLTRSIEEGRLLADTVQRYGRVFRTDSEFRSVPAFHRACELVLNGRIGRLRKICTGTPQESEKSPGTPPTMPVPEELDYDLWLGPAPLAPYTLERVHPRHENRGRPGWMRVLDYCDGMILNWGTHLNDIAQWGNGTERTGPVEVEARGTYPASGLWNALIGFEAWYRYANGVELSYKMDKPFIRFEGDGGWVEAAFGQREIKIHPESLASSVIKPNEIHLPLKSDKRDFLDAVKTRSRTLEDAEVGHRTSSVCHLAHISIQLGGRKLRWDPDAEKFPGDDEANRLTRRAAMRPPWTLA
jgi:predicted dehydrogenase